MNSAVERRMLVGKRIKQLREDHKMMQSELAAKVGVTPECISNIERGTRGGKMETLIGISKVFSITLDDLTESPPPKEPSQMAV